jgi:hypothetical protein
MSNETPLTDLAALEKLIKKHHFAFSNAADAESAKYIASIRNALRPGEGKEGAGLERQIREAWLAGREWGSSESFCSEHSCSPDEREMAAELEKYVARALAAGPRPSSSQPPGRWRHMCPDGAIRSGFPKTCPFCLLASSSPESLGGRRLIVQSPDAEDQK